MSKQKNPFYKSSRKKNPTPEEVMHDIKVVASRNHVYVKGAEVDNEYFWDCVQRVKHQSYYFALRLESLAYRYERAKRNHKHQRSLKVA